MLSICDLLLYLPCVAQGRRVLIAIALGLLKVGDKTSVPFPVVLDLSPLLHLILPSHTCASSSPPTLALSTSPTSGMFHLTPFFACNSFVCCDILYRLLVKICSFWTLKEFSTTSEYLCQRSSLLMLSATDCFSC